MSQSVFDHCPDVEGTFTDADFNTVLNDAYDTLDTMENGAPKKMGTTLTFLKLHSDGATIAHIGDSRVYHIRPGKDVDDTKILFQTRDHSLINDLIKIGELTPEEAKHSKQKNIITRAMQPNMEYRPKADLYHTKDILPGDYVMLCSDGILEQMEEDNIRFIFSDKGGNARSKVNMLKKVTENNRDNHSAIVVNILDVKNTFEKAFPKNNTQSTPTTRSNDVANMPVSTNKRPFRWIMIFLIMILLTMWLIAIKCI